MTDKIINFGNLPDLNCNDISPVKKDLNSDPTKPFCDDNCLKEESLNDIPGNSAFAVLNDISQKKGIGTPVNCDPMQTGQLVNTLPAGNTIYRYAKTIRGADEAMLKMFNTLSVFDEQGKGFPIPIIYGSQERAVAFFLQQNVRKDKTLEVDRIKLPMLAINNNDVQYDISRHTFHGIKNYGRSLRADNKPGYTIKERGRERSTIFGVSRGLPINISYTLYAWTLYLEDMNQILEQILLKFDPFAYIRIRGVSWETIVKLESTANNIDMEPGDKNLRVLKYQFNLTVQTYIPQPIVRKKAVLDTKIDIFNSVNNENINDVYGRIEESVDDEE